ncbi:MAG: diguanylate cyclase [Firmicutes bacterium]|nr:diguanylate cyclase [Bacillota bacterium]
MVEVTRVLSQLTGLPVHLIDLRMVGDRVSPRVDAGDVVAMAAEVQGGRPMEAVLAVPRHLAVLFLEAVLKDAVEWPPSGIAWSALLELGNIALAAFVNVLADMMRGSWPVTPPRLLSEEEYHAWLNEAWNHPEFLATEVTWLVAGHGRFRWWVMWDQHRSRPASTGAAASALAQWEWVKPEHWDNLVDRSAWFPLAMRWATAWAGAFSLPHWPEVVVRGLPFSVGSLWRITSAGDYAEVLAFKGYRLLHRTRVPLHDPRQNLIAAAYHWRVPMPYPHDQVFPLMRHLTDAQRVLAIPLATPEGVVGILTIGEIEIGQWSDELAAAIQDFAPILAQAMVQHFRLQELERHAALFRWMNDVVVSVWDPTTGYRVRQGEVEAPLGILRPWRREWPRLAGIRGGIWVFWDEERMRWRIIDAWGPWTLRTSYVYYHWWPKVRQWLEEAPAEARQRGWRRPPHPVAVGRDCVYWFPVLEGERIIGGGILWIPSTWEESGDVLDSVLDVVGMALIAVRRQRQLTRQSLRDPLTDALNRRGLEQVLDHVMQSQPARSMLFCVADLDRFKPVNDTWGHTVGDHLLQDWAHYVRRTLRASDWVARIGGDEFIWLLADCSWTPAVQSRLRQLVEEGPLRPYHTSATVGVVEMPREARTYQDAYRLADQRLYAGKNLGRGRMVGPSGEIVVFNVADEDQQS